MNVEIEKSSFRDKSGCIFYNNGSVFRAINQSYKTDFDLLHSSGLYDELTRDGLLIAHREVNNHEISEAVLDFQTVYKIIQVEKIPFISYPYEWCFEQLKDAALATLDIQMRALKHGLVLKDASAFNIQFYKGKPVFIDTLSFEKYVEGKPWIAYRQFCQHFLAPLALMSKVDPALGKMSEMYIDGIPLSLASKLLPYKTRFSPFYQLHLHYHAKLESKYAGDVKADTKLKRGLSKQRLTAIIDHLQSGIKGLHLQVDKTEWNNYYNEFSYTEPSIEHKKALVYEWAKEIKPSMVFDLGSNTGMFSDLIRDVASDIIAFDIDQLAIEKLYRNNKKKNIENILPLLLDLSNPAPAIGWANEERKSFAGRGQANLVLALALIHHISISNNVPFQKVAALFSRLTETLIIEFVPKHDSQSQRLLVTREDIFDDYTQENFENAFLLFFSIDRKENIRESERTLYLMTRK
jgi:hypothetical protein